MTQKLFCYVDETGQDTQGRLAEFSVTCPRKRNNAKMHIREATPDDIAGIARVHVDAWRTTYRGIVPDAHLDGLSYERSESKWRRIFAQQVAGAFVLVVEDDAGRIVGFANGGPEREGDPIYRGEVGGIYLLAEIRRRGVGHSLMAEAARRLLAHGFETLLVWVLAPNPSRNFYAALGGRPIKEKPITIGGAELIEVAYGWADIRPLAALGGASHET
jgi:L-amino acid N-acyltransferase YncA